MDAGHLAVRFTQAAAAHGSRPATRVAAGDDWLVRTYSELAGDVRRLAARLIRLRARTRRSSRHLLHQPAGMESCRPRLRLCWPGLRPAVPVEFDQARHIRVRAGCLVGSKAGKWPRWPPSATTCPAWSGWSPSTEVPGATRPPLAAELAAAPADLSAVDARLADGVRGRPGHDHLHLRHHRRAQGRDAVPPRFHPSDGRAEPRAGDHSGGLLTVLPAAQPRAWSGPGPTWCSATAA